MRFRHDVRSVGARSVVVALVAALAVASWATPAFAGSPVMPPGPPPSGPPTPFVSANVEVQVANSPEGPVLVTGPAATFGADGSGAGFALYAFSGDSEPSSLEAFIDLHCNYSNQAPSSPPTPCTTPWPPLTVPSGTTPVAGPGVVQAELSTVTVTPPAASGLAPYDQVTYFGRPLYGFVKDKAPGQFVGEDFAVFSGVFWLVSPNGQPDAGVAQVGTEVTPSGIALAATMGNAQRTLYMLSYDTPGPSMGMGGGMPGPMSGIGPVGPARPVGPPQAAAAQTTCLSSTGCAAIWPPLLTTGRPVAGPGVDPRLLGELRRPDGALQVTYDGWPVYLYYEDSAPTAAAGATNGEYLLDNHADGVWYEVAPQGGPNPGTAMLTTVDGLVAVSSTAVPPANPDATVYTFTPATSGGTCTGECARFWPPVLTSTAPAEAAGLTGTLGTVQRADGTFQVTYNGAPLYLFSQSLTSGDADGASITTPFGTFAALSS